MGNKIKQLVRYMYTFQSISAHFWLSISSLVNLSYLLKWVMCASSNETCFNFDEEILLIYFGICAFSALVCPSCLTILTAEEMLNFVILCYTKTPFSFSSISFYSIVVVPFLETRPICWALLKNTIAEINYRHTIIDIADLSGTRNLEHVKGMVSLHSAKTLTSTLSGVIRWPHQPALTSLKVLQCARGCQWNSNSA